MDETELAALNVLLAANNQSVRVVGNVYQLCNLTPVQTIVDIEAFALIYGVEVGA